MKTFLTLLSLTATSVQAGWPFLKFLRRKGRCLTGYTTYTATFDKKEPLAKGFEGEFLMDICNSGDRVRYDIDVEGDFGAVTELNYHLHSLYGDAANAGELTGTSGHYDPTFRCGAASSNKFDETRCAGDYPNNGYELGDLSGKNGKLQVSNGMINAKIRERGDAVPRNADWSITGQAAGALYSSIIFHKCVDGNCAARFFGARLIKNCKANIFRATLNGDGINRGVIGVFTMSICKDGSFAVYEGDFENINTRSLGLNYHLHSAYNSAAANDGELGGAGTGGHYDPFFKCGGASSYKDSPLCEPDYPTNGYELGDLSGKLGKVATAGTDGQKTSAFRVVDSEPPRAADYDPVGRTNFGDTFSSIVFHCDITDGIESCKTRVFGAKLVKVL